MSFEKRLPQVSGARTGYVAFALSGSSDDDEIDFSGGGGRSEGNSKKINYNHYNIQEEVGEDFNFDNNNNNEQEEENHDRSHSIPDQDSRSSSRSGSSRKVSGGFNNNSNSNTQQITLPVNLTPVSTYSKNPHHQQRKKSSPRSFVAGALRSSAAASRTPPSVESGNVMLPPPSILTQSNSNNSNTNKVSRNSSPLQSNVSNIKQNLPPLSPSSVSNTPTTSSVLLPIGQQQQQQNTNNIPATISSSKQQQHPFMQFVGVLDANSARKFRTTKSSSSSSDFYSSSNVIGGEQQQQQRNKNKAASSSSTSSSAHEKKMVVNQEEAALLNRISHVFEREEEKVSLRKQREQDQLTRDAKEIDTWFAWHKEVAAREAHLQAMAEAEEAQQYHQSLIEAAAVENANESECLSSSSNIHNNSNDFNNTNFSFGSEANNESFGNNNSNYNDNNDNDDSLPSGTPLQYLRHLQQHQRLRRSSRPQLMLQQSNFNMIRSGENVFGGIPITAEQEYLQLSHRLNLRVSVTNMLVCEHEEQKERSRIDQEEENEEWNQLLDAFEQGAFLANVAFHSRLLFIEINQQRGDFFNDFLQDLSVISDLFLKEKSRIRQADLYSIFLSVDEEQQQKLLQQPQEEREVMLDEIKEERLLKSRVSKLRALKRNL